MYGRLILLVLLVAFLVAGVIGYQMIRWADSPVTTDSRRAQSKIVTIPDGATFQQIAAQLERERLIKSRSRFVFLGRSNSADRRIISGEYELHPGMTPQEILDKLVAGEVVLHPITVPEGYSIAQIAEILDIDKLVDAREFRRLCTDREFIRSLEIDAASLEGYLFPDTYHVSRGTKAKDLIHLMLSKLWQVFTPAWRIRATDMRLTTHQVLTLASVIEKETSVGEERELISAVFHNRLRRKIPLQSDPTVIYGLGQFDGNLRKRDLSNHSPYNTYRVRGLPPGPIASPGAHSIRAALYPANAAYLYFVSRNDGTHYFSSTLDEHNHAVEKFQKRPFRRMAGTRL
jgi:UPF0755 protein